VTGYDRQTLMNMVYVASHFEFSRRREGLSWSHHAELAALEPEDQERWLDHSEQERLSVRDLREELATVQPSGRKRGRSPSGSSAVAAEREREASRSSSTRPGSHRLVACPECGHRFEA
jgi:hypothetical protein